MKTAEAQVIDCPVIVLVGPTAIGKTALSLQLVQRFDCEIVSMDSMQVYRHMNIGTAKPDPEEQALVPHHLLDIVNPDEQYDAARFIKDAVAAMADIATRKRTVLLTGGTGFYLKALLEGLFTAMPADKNVRRNLQQRLQEEGREVLHAELCEIDPVSGAKIHKNDSQRLLRALEIYQTSGKTWSALLREQKEANAQNRITFKRLFQVALTCERPKLYQRIEERSKIMLNRGLVEEVAGLLDMGYASELPSMQSIGYRHVNNLLAGTWNRDEMIEHLVRDTRRYAKRQLTWFSRQQGLNWFEREQQDGVGDRIAAELDL